jgi:hypothetical protein
MSLVSRFRIAGFVGCSALLLLVFSSSPAPRPLELAAPATTARLGVVATGAGTSLVRLNPLSLKRTGRALDVKGFAGVWAFAPEGRRLAIGVRRSANASTETLRFYTTAGPRPVGPGVALGGPAAALGWLRSDRILAYVNDCCPNPNGTSSVVAIDVRARRVLSRTPLNGSVLQIARSRDSLILLVAAMNRIGPSRLEIFDADGGHRSAKLDDVVAGHTWPEAETDVPVGSRLIPGLAIAATENRAFVVSPSGLIAEVDLGSLAVSYHRWVEQQSAFNRFAGWLTPAAEAKGANGPVLRARWLQGGFLAVTGTAETATTTGGKLRVSSRPLGLRIVDVRDWSASMLDAGADSVAIADGLLLAAGSSWNSEPQSQSGMGLAGYGADRPRRFQFQPGKPAWIGFVYRGRAYVSVANQSALRIVDLASGRLVGMRRTEAPWPLLDDSVSLY